LLYSSVRHDQRASDAEFFEVLGKTGHSARAESDRREVVDQRDRHTHMLGMPDRTGETGVRSGVAARGPRNTDSLRPSEPTACQHMLTPIEHVNYG
jgi:hypothetical protein